MPIYSYDCDTCGSSTDHVCRFEDRPDEIVCGECADKSVRRELCWNPPAESKNSHPVYGKAAGSDSPSEKERVYTYKCEDGHISVEYYASPPKEMPCDDCEKMAAKETGCNLDMHWSKFPYYDRGLGCIVKSEYHRRAVAKSRGLVPVDGDWDMDKEVGKLEAGIEREKEEYRDYYDRIHTDPAYRDFLKARDDGRVPDMIQPD